MNDREQAMEEAQRLVVCPAYRERSEHRYCPSCAGRGFVVDPAPIAAALLKWKAQGKECLLDGRGISGETIREFFRAQKGGGK